MFVCPRVQNRDRKKEGENDRKRVGEKDRQADRLIDKVRQLDGSRDTVSTGFTFLFFVFVCLFVCFGFFVCFVVVVVVVVVVRT